MEAKNKILVANIGSTSFKFRLFEMPSERLLARGAVERIGASQGAWKAQVGDSPPEEGQGAFPDYNAAIALVEEKLAGRALGGLGELAAVGFKPVMAKDISGTQVLDDHVLAAMEALYTLLPAHNPPYVKAVRAFRARHPELPCIGTFETAFYDNLPRRKRRFPIPLAWETKYGIRREGFHGASHRYVTERAAELRGARNLRMISCHLGGSSSICAVRDGVAIDSSWGMTAQSGLPHNNRVGDFDVFAALYVQKIAGLTVEQMEDALAKDAGLKGMSGLASGDIRDVRAAAAAGNEDARTALAAFVDSIRKYVGQFLVEMNGADVLIFAGGIGENNPDLRAEVCAGMDFCGLRLDAAANEQAVGREAVISARDSRIEVRVIPTNEEIIIARNAWEKLGHARPAGKF